jgi:hypothetical protein
MDKVMLSLENTNEEGDDVTIQAFDNIILESKTDLTNRIKDLVNNLENPYVALYII